MLSVARGIDFVDTLFRFLTRLECKQLKQPVFSIHGFIKVTRRVDTPGKEHPSFHGEGSLRFESLSQLRTCCKPYAWRKTNNFKNMNGIGKNIENR